MMVMKIAMMKMKLLVLMLAAQLLSVNSSEDEDDSGIVQVFEELNKRIDEVKKSCQVRKVAFSASLQPTVVKSSGYGIIGPFSDASTLVHGHIITNIGNAYSPHTGVFTAPVSGVYFFTYTTYGWATKANIGASLFKNGEEVVQIWEYQDEGDNEDYATNSATLILKPGDIVYLQLFKGFQVASSTLANVHTFTGFLLYQL